MLAALWMGTECWRHYGWVRNVGSTIKVFSPTDAQVNCLKNNFKIDIKTAATCFGAVSHTIIRERITGACSSYSC
jgi:hypothetical protein